MSQVYVIGEEGLVEELQSAGFTVVGGPEHRGQALDWSAQGEPAVDVDPEVRGRVYRWKVFVHAYAALLTWTHSMLT